MNRSHMTQRMAGRVPRSRGCAALLLVCSLGAGQAMAQDWQPLHRDTLQRVLHAQGGVLQSRNMALLLAPDHRYVLRVAFGVAGRGVNASDAGHWRVDAQGRVCLSAPPAAPQMFAAAPSAQGAVASSDDDAPDLDDARLAQLLRANRQAGLVASDPQVLAQIRVTQAQPVKAWSRRAGQVPMVMAQDAYFPLDVTQASFEVVAPTHRHSTQYVRQRYQTLAAGTRYLLVLPQKAGALADALPPCMALDDLPFEQARLLQAGEAQRITQAANALLDPQQFAGPSREPGAPVWQRVRPMQTQAASQPEPAANLLCEDCVR